MTVGWKGRKTKNRFPSLTTALGNRCCDSHLPTGRRLFHLSQNRKPKGVPRYRPSFLTSGSFFDENMLASVTGDEPCIPSPCFSAFDHLYSGRWGWAQRLLDPSL